MKDLTKGNVLKTLISFSLPIIGGNLFQLLYNFSDSLIVGNILGVNELAGVGATGSLNFFVVGFATGVCTGFSIVVARFFGAKNEEGLRRSIAHSLVLAVLIGLVLSVVSVLMLDKILTWMNTPEEVAKVLKEGSLYLRAHLSFFFFLGPIFIYRNTMQGIGNKTMPLVSSLLELGLKIVTALWVAPSLGYIGIAFCEPVAWVICGTFLMVFFYLDSRVKALKVKKA